MMIPVHTLGHNTKGLWVANSHHVCSASGFLQCIEAILDLICVIVIVQYCRPAYSISDAGLLGFLGTTQETFFFIVSWFGFIETLMVFITHTLSYPSAVLMQRTVHGRLTTFTIFVLHIFSSLLLMQDLINKNMGVQYKEYGYEAKIALTILGILNGILYLMSFFLALYGGKTIMDPD